MKIKYKAECQDKHCIEEIGNTLYNTKEEAIQIAETHMMQTGHIVEVYKEIIIRVMSD